MVWVQVVEQQGEGEGTPQLAEAHLTGGLAHPNIVLTHKTVSRTRTVRSFPAILALLFCQLSLQALYRSLHLLAALHDNLPLLFTAASTV